jgi:hypothetical protein
LPRPSKHSAASALQNSASELSVLKICQVKKCAASENLNILNNNTVDEMRFREQGYWQHLFEKIEGK